MPETVYQIEPRANPSTRPAGHVTTSSPRVAYAAYVAGSIVTPSPVDIVKPEDLTPEARYHRDPFHVNNTGDAGGDAELFRTLARDLYETHLRTGISLDKWDSARRFVEAFYGPIVENGA